MPEAREKGGRGGVHEHGRCGLMAGGVDMAGSFKEPTHCVCSFHEGLSILKLYLTV